MQSGIVLYVLRPLSSSPGSPVERKHQRHFKNFKMPPKSTPRVASGPVQADSDALEAYQMRLMLLEQQRLSLQAIKNAAGNPNGQNRSERAQGQSNSECAIPARQTVLRQSNGTFASASGDSNMKGNENMSETIEGEDGNSGDSGEAMEEDEEGDEEGEQYCTCRSVRYGNMVRCKNEDCPYEWFHSGCVGITQRPSGPWFCKECRSRM